MMGERVDLGTGQILRRLPSLDRTQFQRSRAPQMTVADCSHHLLAAGEHDESEGGLLIQCE